MLLGFLVLLISLLCVHAQNTSVSCSSTYDWMHNSKGQSPCLTAAWLQYPCIGNNKVGPASYPGPSNETALLCECNTVFYMTLAACAVCQGAGLGGIALWSSFSQHCPNLNVTIQQYPQIIPNATSIPVWAYIPLLNDTFNLKAAQYLASLDALQTSSGGTTSSSTVASSTFTSLPLSATRASTSSVSASPSATAQQEHLSYLGGGALVAVMVVSLLGLSAAITGIVVLVRRKWLPSTGKAQFSALWMSVNVTRMPRLRMPPLRMPAVRMPALHMPATLHIPTLGMRAFRMPAMPIPAWCNLRRGRQPDPSSSVEGKYPMFYDPDDPRTFPPLPTPEEIYFYRCHRKAAAHAALGCNRSHTDVTVTLGGVLASTVSSTIASYPLPTSPLRGYNWQPEGEV
ncbi:hypothetical protein GSI_14548 [Ganoderma sinense ZZ0214-1]|uniref:Uncharacterized protein n=1 Tax=Ganoderma sinense ZZ0214-1 TaxID=1077348 RepID=A0A2G8RPH4_9APHY|nr:hypothetical protein GSI_14548 [Ganoderma sinense ZZ0214-1]